MLELLLRNKSQNHFLEKIFRSRDNKSFKPEKCSLVIVFGVHHSNVPLLSALKHFIVCSEKVHIILS